MTVEDILGILNITLENITSIRIIEFKDGKAVVGVGTASQEQTIELTYSEFVALMAAWVEALKAVFEPKGGTPPPPSGGRKPKN